MVLPAETCQDCGKTIKGRAIPRVWHGERVLCPGCYRTLAAAAEQADVAATPTMRQIPVASARGTDDVLAEIVRFAESRRLTCIAYQKPGEWSDTQRFVEPYRLQESTASLMVQCWQVDPAIEDRCKWRNFRIDRISSVCDGGRTFEPRIPITLGTGEVTAFEWGHEPAVILGPAAEYFNFVESAMLDGLVTADEFAKAQELGGRVSMDERRGAHARVFANVLQEVLQDSAVSDKEAAYLAKVRAFLSRLGWAP